MELESLSFEIRLYENQLKYKLLEENPDISYINLIMKINKKVDNKFKKKRELLLKNLLTAPNLN